MTAYELADAIEDWDSDGQWDTPAAVMLRQQADRIAELEKQTKPLSDEEICKIYNITGLGKGMAVRFARAIEERHGIK